MGQVFRAIPDPWQVDVLRALGDPAKKRIAMQACKGPGKTCLLAWSIWWFLLTQADRGTHPKGAATSITADNLADNLWPELAHWQGRSEVLKKAFEWSKLRIVNREHPETWFFSARSWPKSGDAQRQADTLAGLHADFVFFVLDESGGIPVSVLATAEAALSGGRWSKIIQCGNPTHLEGALYHASVSHRDLWHVTEITGDPDDPKRSTRVDAKIAREQIDTYGRTNPWVLVNIFGRFPPASLNTLLGPDEVRDAMRRHLPEDVYSWSQRRLGVDVARFGDDSTVLFPRQGLASFLPVEMRGARTTEIAARILEARRKWNTEVVLIDDTGHWGHGVIDNLIVAGQSVIPIQFHAPALDPRYRNRRAEMWFGLADWVKRGGALPDVPGLVGELTTPQYTFSGGKIMLEDKDQIKARLGRSPDFADALACTFAIPDQPAGDSLQALIGKAGQLQSEWDPYRDEPTH